MSAVPDRFSASETIRMHNQVSATSSFETFRKGVFLTRAIQFSVGGIFVAAIFLSVLTSGMNPLLLFGVPIVAIAVGLAGILIWIGSVSPQLWHVDVGRIARKNNLAMFAIGRTPIGSGYLVFGREGVIVLSRKLDVTACFPYAGLEGAALFPSVYGVGTVFRYRDEYFEFPIVLRVGGPTAEAWSNDGFIGRGRLLKRLREDLYAHGVRTVLAGPAAYKTESRAV